MPRRISQHFTRALPFALTGAQRRVIGEILQDFTRGRPMCRLVQGDVGSGKTMVAAAAIVCAAKNGVQSALLAPTEILAEQHFQSLAPLFERLGLRCGQLTGSQKVSEKRALRAALQAGELDVVIGTHALLSGTTAFANLGLVVTDEQHPLWCGPAIGTGSEGGAAAFAAALGDANPPDTFHDPLRRSGCLDSR